MRRQRGVVFILFAVVLAIVGVAMVMGASSLQAQSAANRQVRDREAYLKDTAQQLEAWYRSRVSTVDIVADAPDPDVVAQEANVSKRYGVRIAVSNRIVTGDLGYRVIVLWIPAAQPDASTFDPNTAAFVPATGVEYQVVNGQPIQQQAISETRRTLSNIAVSLVNYFAARYETGGKDVSINYFRPDATCSSTGEGLPCWDTYTSVSGVDWGSLGLPNLALNDAWGNAIEISNLADSQTAAPPYSIAIRAHTPFGTYLTMNAYQRL